MKMIDTTDIPITNVWFIHNLGILSYIKEDSEILKMISPLNSYRVVYNFTVQIINLDNIHIFFGRVLKEIYAVVYKQKSWLNKHIINLNRNH